MTVSIADPIDVDLSADRANLSRAERFVLEMADLLVAKGREVQVTRTDLYRGQSLHLWSPAPRYYEKSISVSAGSWRNDKGHIYWNFQQASAMEKHIKPATTYARARSLVETWS